MHFVHTLFTYKHVISFNFMPKNMVLLCKYECISMSIYDKYAWHAGIHIVLHGDMLLCINIGMFDLIILTQITLNRFLSIIDVPYMYYSKTKCNT